MDRPTDLPAGLIHARTTDLFDETNHPAALRRAHHVAQGVWARLLVHSGSLRFVFEDQPDEPITITAGGDMLIPPKVRHHVEFDGPASFALEFHRRPTADEVAPGTESTGLNP